MRRRALRLADSRLEDPEKVLGDAWVVLGWCFGDASVPWDQKATMNDCARFQMPNHLGAGSYEKEDCRTREQHQKNKRLDGWTVGQVLEHIYIYIWDPIYIYTHSILCFYI